MNNFTSVNDALDFAVSEEQAAAEFYRHLAKTVSMPSMRQVFEDFAMEEVAHQQKLLLVKEEKLQLPAEDTILSLTKGTYFVESLPEDAMEYQQALRLAIEKEQAAFTLYRDLASATEDEALRSIFLALAEEEAKHKSRFEVEYGKHFS